MALTATTLSAACAATDFSITVASATGFAAGDYVKIDEEFCRVSQTYSSGTSITLSGRGLNGTTVEAHPATANVTVGTGSDFSDPNAAVVTAYPYAGRRRKVVSYSAAGAITLPQAGEDVVAIINGTSALAMTIAAPTKDIDGSILYVVSNGVANHTIQYTGGLSGAGASYDVATINSSAPVCLALAMACNGLWMSIVSTPLAGTVTNITATIG